MSITVIDNFISKQDAKYLRKLIKNNHTLSEKNFAWADTYIFQNDPVVKKYIYKSIENHKKLNDYNKDIVTYSATGSIWLPGSFSETHSDTNYAPWVEFTTILYLSDSFEGGLVNFPNQNFEYHPKKCSAVLFPSSQKEYDHNISEILSGERYTALFMHTSTLNYKEIIFD